VKRDTIVVGASAGGVAALQALVAGLPADLAASVFVVLHVPSWRRSELPEILSHAGPLPAVHAEHNQPTEPGRIYVAPPDYHLLAENSHVRLWRGPKENMHRPSINALFRAAAVSHGRRVTGVILSGTLEDGIAGLWWIKRHGGVAIVQEPSDATFPEMPNGALAHVEVDHVVKACEMGPLLAKIAAGEELQSQPRPHYGEEQSTWKRNAY
jgi:two-component system chemotaxis response regulator CheB